MLSNIYKRIEFFFVDYQQNVISPPLLVTQMITSLEAKMFKKDEVMIRIGENVDALLFIFVGVAHIYSISQWNDEDI